MHIQYVGLQVTMDIECDVLFVSWFFTSNQNLYLSF